VKRFFSLAAREKAKATHEVAWRIVKGGCGSVMFPGVMPNETKLPVESEADERTT
jgi:hypothetical protein